MPHRHSGNRLPSVFGSVFNIAKALRRQLGIFAQKTICPAHDCILFMNNQIAPQQNCRHCRRKRSIAAKPDHAGRTVLKHKNACLHNPDAGLEQTFDFEPPRLSDQSPRINRIIGNFPQPAFIIVLAPVVGNQRQTVSAFQKFFRQSFGRINMSAGSPCGQHNQRLFFFSNMFHLYPPHERFYA